MIKPFKDTNKKTVRAFQKTMMFFDIKSFTRLMHILCNRVCDKIDTDGIHPYTYPQKGIGWDYTNY